MHIRQLQYFLVVAEEQSFTRAATRVHIGQSPLSRAIKELEEELGVPLFERSKGRIRLTWSGEVLQDDVRRLLSFLKNIRARTKAAEFGYRGHLRIALTDGLAQPRMTELLAKCREEEPQTDVRVFEMTVGEMAHALKFDQIDAGFTVHTGYQTELLVKDKVWTDRLVFAIPIRHQLLARDKLSLMEAIRHPMIICHPDQCEGGYDVIHQLFQSTKLEPIVAEYVSGHELMMMFVAAGYGMPLAVPLFVDQERVVFIDRNVRVGVPVELTGKLRVQSTGGAIYLRANEVIEPSRLQLQDADTGALILLDIAATRAHKEQPALEPVRIVEGDNTPKRYGTANTVARVDDGQEDETATKPTREPPVPVVLTRYAAQNLFAPLRTVEPVNSISRVNLRRDLPLSSLLPSLPVHARALAAWRLEDYWVTAVRLHNSSASTLALDPRALQGDFVTATFQHPDLGPAGQPSDTTVVYLVTQGHGIAESLLPAVSKFDAALNLPAPVRGGRNEK